MPTPVGVAWFSHAWRGPPPTRRARHSVRLAITAPEARCIGVRSRLAQSRSRFASSCILIRRLAVTSADAADALEASRFLFVFLSEKKREVCSRMSVPLVQNQKLRLVNRINWRARHSHLPRHDR